MTNPTAGTGLLPQGSQAELLQKSHPASIRVSIGAALAAACLCSIVLSLVKIPAREAVSLFGARYGHRKIKHRGWAGLAALKGPCPHSSCRPWLAMPATSQH